MLAQAARSSIRSGTLVTTPGRGLDTDDRAVRPPFDGLESDGSPVQRVTAIVNRAMLPYRAECARSVSPEPHVPPRGNTAC